MAATGPARVRCCSDSASTEAARPRPEDRWPDCVRHRRAHHRHRDWQRGQARCACRSVDQVHDSIHNNPEHSSAYRHYACRCGTGKPGADPFRWQRHQELSPVQRRQRPAYHHLPLRLSNFGQSGNFQADLEYGNQSSLNSDDQMIANDLAMQGGQTTTVYPQDPGKDYYLSVNSECSWHLKVVGQ
jgi:hypothetical protein